MDEQLLHYIWKFQKFNGRDLISTDGQPITIFSSGNHNHDSGPDFEQARIKIGDIEWAGQVEIHVKSSDWIRHGHQKNPCYDNVILHVVWEHDREIHLTDGPVPTLALNERVEEELLDRYQWVKLGKEEILCGKLLSGVSDMVFHNMLDRSLVERLQAKANEIHASLSKNTNDWEEITYLCLAKNFGFSVNKYAFSQLATDLPFQVVKKYFHQPMSIEALLFGMAGFLENPTDDYQKQLADEYGYLRRKHELIQRLEKSSWKFGKMRPANFPSVRIAQFASLLSSKFPLFQFFIEHADSKQLIKKLQTSTAGYWQEHYDFGKPRKRKARSIGTSTVENLIINTIAPLLVSYAKFTDDQQHLDQALQLLEHVRGEKNHITKKWEQLDKHPQHAFDTQAMIGLYKVYCSNRKCLHCAIGAELMSK